MAASRGRWPNYAACWGCPDVGRAATHGPAYLVPQPTPLVEGSEMRKAPEPTKVQGLSQSLDQRANFIKPAYFLGADNPRRLQRIFMTGRGLA